MSNARNIASIAGEDVLNASNEIVPVYACRAWVNFDGTYPFSPTPSTSAIIGAGNVTSIYANGTGDFTVNFTVAMPDLNYCVLVTGETPPASGNFMSVGQVTSKGTSSIRIENKASHNYVNYNLSNINLVIFR